MTFNGWFGGRGVPWAWGTVLLRGPWVADCGRSVTPGLLLRIAVVATAPAAAPRPRSPAPPSRCRRLTLSARRAPGAGGVGGSSASSVMVNGNSKQWSRDAFTHARPVLANNGKYLIMLLSMSE